MSQGFNNLANLRWIHRQCLCKWQRSRPAGQLHRRKLPQQTSQNPPSPLPQPMISVYGEAFIKLPCQSLWVINESGAVAIICHSWIHISENEFQPMFKVRVQHSPNDRDTPGPLAAIALFTINYSYILLFLPFILKEECIPWNNKKYLHLQVMLPPLFPCSYLHSSFISTFFLFLEFPL